MKELLGFQRCFWLLETVIDTQAEEGDPIKAKATGTIASNYKPTKSI